VTRWWLAVALVLSLGVNVGVLATLAVQRLRAEPAVEAPRAPREAPRPEQLHHLGRRLQLEGQELERFVALHQEFLRRSRESRERLASLRREARRQMAAGEPSMEALEPVLQEMGAAYLELERELAAHVIEARQMLDPEAEERYLRLISRLGMGRSGVPHGGPGPRGRGPGRR
jgi:hypothetical protein